MELLQGFFSGAVAMLFAWYWNAKKDDEQNRIDDLCGAILDAANLSTEYWLLPASSDHLKEKEARIIGRQHQVALLLEMLDQIQWTFSDVVAQELTDFLDALTGGDFEVQLRDADLGRAKAVQICAAALSVKIRKMHASTKRWFWL